MVINDTHVGLVAEVHPVVVEAFDIDGTPVAMFELDLERLLSVLPEAGRRYVPLSRFPRASRDLSILAGLDVPAAKIYEIVQGHRLVSQALLFDVYTGDNIPVGKRSLSFRIYFQSSERTLTSDEVNTALQGVIGSLEKQLAISVRGL